METFLVILGNRLHLQAFIWLHFFRQRLVSVSVSSVKTVLSFIKTNQYDVSYKH